MVGAICECRTSEPADTMTSLFPASTCPTAVSKRSLVPGMQVLALPPTELSYNATTGIVMVTFGISIPWDGVIGVYAPGGATPPLNDPNYLQLSRLTSMTPAAFWAQTTTGNLTAVGAVVIASPFPDPCGYRFSLPLNRTACTTSTLIPYQVTRQCPITVAVYAPVEGNVTAYRFTTFVQTLTLTELTRFEGLAVNSVNWICSLRDEQGSLWCQLDEAGSQLRPTGAWTRFDTATSGPPVAANRGGAFSQGWNLEMRFDASLASGQYQIPVQLNLVGGIYRTSFVFQHLRQGIWNNRMPAGTMQTALANNSYVDWSSTLTFTFVANTPPATISTVWLVKASNPLLNVSGTPSCNPLVANPTQTCTVPLASLCGSGPAGLCVGQTLVVVDVKYVGGARRQQLGEVTETVQWNVFFPDGETTMNFTSSSAPTLGPAANPVPKGDNTLFIEIGVGAGVVVLLALVLTIFALRKKLHRAIFGGMPTASEGKLPYGNEAARCDLENQNELGIVVSAE